MRCERCSLFKTEEKDRIYLFTCTGTKTGSRKLGERFVSAWDHKVIYAPKWCPKKGEKI